MFRLETEILEINKEIEQYEKIKEFYEKKFKGLFNNNTQKKIKRTEIKEERINDEDYETDDEDLIEEITNIEMKKDKNKQENIKIKENEKNIETITEIPKNEKIFLKEKSNNEIKENQNYNNIEKQIEKPNINIIESSNISEKTNNVENKRMKTPIKITKTQKLQAPTYLFQNNNYEIPESPNKINTENEKTFDKNLYDVVYENKKFTEEPQTGKKRKISHKSPDNKNIKSTKKLTKIKIETDTRHLTYGREAGVFDLTSDDINEAINKNKNIAIRNIPKMGNNLEIVKKERVECEECRDCNI
jgi:hypothetical protein